jgi:hypothetical protein
VQVLSNVAPVKARNFFGQVGLARCVEAYFALAVSIAGRAVLLLA